MKINNLLSRLEKLSNEANQSADREVFWSAGILHCLIVAIKLGDVEDFAQHTAKFVKIKLAITKLINGDPS